HHSIILTSLYTPFLSFFFFNTPPTPDIYTLSLHDALPISQRERVHRRRLFVRQPERPNRFYDPGVRCAEQLLHAAPVRPAGRQADRKSTRLNSSHLGISYAVFCLKKKKKKIT